MKKRLFGIVLALAMVMCMMPLGVNAATNPCGISIAGESIDADTLYGVGGTSIDGLTAGTVKYVSASKTLIIDGAEISVTEGHDGITIGIDGVSLCIKNSNKITCTNDGDSYGVRCEDDSMLILGDGTLTVSTNVKQDAINVCKNLTINETPTINITQCDTGIDATSITFNGAPQININASGKGIVCKGGDMNFALQEGGKVSVTSLDVAVYAEDGKVTLADSNKVTTPANGKVFIDDGHNSGMITDGDENPVTTAVIEGPTKKAGVNTSDSSDIALFGMIAVIALAGAGFAAKKKFN